MQAPEGAEDVEAELRQPKISFYFKVSVILNAPIIVIFDVYRMQRFTRLMRAGIMKKNICRNPLQYLYVTYLIDPKQQKLKPC